MKIKVSKHKFNIHYRGSLCGVELRNTRIAYVMHISNTLSFCLDKKQPEAKIPIPFLFS